MNELDARIALVGLTARSPFLRSLRVGFEAVGIQPAHLILVSPRDRIWAEWRKHRLSVVNRSLGPKARQLFGRRDESEPVPLHSADPAVIHMRRLNSDEMVTCIRRLGIRYLVNAGAGIFRSPLVDLDELVIVNAHPGALPGYRNMNVIEWALYSGDPVIGTVHRIDSGIDTGAVLLTRELDLAGVTSVAEARQRAFDQVARLVGEAVAAHASGELNERAQPASGRNWYVMHPAFVRVLNSRLRASAVEPPSR